MEVGRTLSTEELSRDVQGFAAHNNDLLSLEELLGNGRGEATEEMALAIDGDLYDFRQRPSFSNIYPSQDEVCCVD